MKGREIQQHLRDRLPLYTDRFTDDLDIVSIIPSGTTATVTTATAHGLSVGQRVGIAGANASVDIDTVTRVQGQATFTTVQDHDLTEGFFPQVVTQGVSETEFNGTFTLLSVPNRKKFIVLVTDSGPTSGTGGLLAEPGLPFGYDGNYLVDSVPTTTTFTYTLNQSLTAPATGSNPRVIVRLRIHAAITAERADQVFSQRDVARTLQDGELALFVVLGNLTVSRDRRTLNDGVSSAVNTGDSQQQTFQQLNCIVFQKVTESISGASELDDMQDVMAAIIRVLKGFQADTGFQVQERNSLAFVTHGVLNYDSSIYQHNIEFELLGRINDIDVDKTPVTVAFRNVSWTNVNEPPGTVEYSANINLDEEPEP